MSFQRDFIYTIPESVLLDSRLNYAHLRVYMIVRSFLQSHKGDYFSNDWIATELKMDPNSITKYINELEALGYLTISYEGDNK